MNNNKDYLVYISMYVITPILKENNKIIKQTDRVATAQKIPIHGK